MELSFIVVGLNVVIQNYRDNMVAKLIHHQIETYGNGLKKPIIDLDANSSVPALRLVTACSMPFCLLVQLATKHLRIC
jgi:hypothetical protein